MATKSWVQDPVTGKMIPKDRYREPANKTASIMPDIEPFQSPIDGRVISSRPQLAEHNRRHGVTNTADYSKDWYKKRGQAIKRAQEQRRATETLNTINKAFEG